MPRLKPVVVALPTEEAPELLLVEVPPGPEIACEFPPKLELVWAVLFTTAMPLPMDAVPATLLVLELA